MRFIWSSYFYDCKEELWRPTLIQFFYSLWKETSHEPSKVTAAKNILQCVDYWYDLLRSIFFIPCDDWKILLLVKRFRYFEIFFNCHIASFFETIILKEVFILRYLHNNSMKLILKFPKNTEAKSNSCGGIEISWLYWKANFSWRDKLWFFLQ